MKTQLIIMAHASGEPVLKLTWPFWEKMDATKVIVCPCDGEQIKWPHCEVWQSGLAAHDGRKALPRLKFVLRLACNASFDRTIIAEYDSLLTSFEKLPTEQGFWGITQPNHETARFMSPIYSQPPWLIDTESACLLDQAATTWPSVTEEGVSDRYLAALCFLARVPVLGYKPRGFSQNTILPEHFEEIDRTTRGGGFAYHGIKDEVALAKIVEGTLKAIV